MLYDRLGKCYFMKKRVSWISIVFLIIMKILKRLGNNKVKNKINRNWFDSFYILEYYKLIKT